MYVLWPPHAVLALSFSCFSFVVYFIVLLKVRIEIEEKICRLTALYESMQSACNACV